MSIDTWPKMPPEPEYRDGQWWYKGGKYLKTEAFNEYNDDRYSALSDRLLDTAAVLERCLDHGKLPHAEKWAEYNARAILKRLKEEGLT